MYPNGYLRPRAARPDEVIRASHRGRLGPQRSPAVCSPVNEVRCALRLSRPPSPLTSRHCRRDCHGHKHRRRFVSRAQVPQRVLVPRLFEMAEHVGTREGCEIGIRPAWSVVLCQSAARAPLRKISVLRAMRRDRQLHPERHRRASCRSPAKLLEDKCLQSSASRQAGSGRCGPPTRSDPRVPGWCAISADRCSESTSWSGTASICISGNSTLFVPSQSSSTAPPSRDQRQL